MSLQYIFGGAAAGKTGYILSDIVRHAESGDVRKLIYIVPEQFSLQSERNLVSRLKTGASVTTQVLSFNRLAYHVFSETGNAEFFGDLGKAMLLRKLTYGLNDRLMYFTDSADKQGFIEQLADAVSEFYRYGVTPERLYAYAEKVRSRASLYNKLRDLALIYGEYISYVQSRYIPMDAMLDALAAALPGSGQVRGALIWVSGFHGFTPQEYKVLAELLKHAHRVTVALTLKTAGKSFARPAISDPFYETKRTVNRLTGLAAQLGIAVEEPMLLHSSRANAELGFLEESFMQVSAEYAHAPVDISIRRADNIYSELNQAAADITALVRAGWDYGDIAVLSGDINAHRRDIRSIFGMYDIPVFIDAKTEVLSHPLVELILSALEIAVYNWAYESVFRFLKTGMTALSRDEVDNLENYVLAYGIKGGRWFAKRWKYGFDGGTVYNEEEIHRSKEYCLSVLKPFKPKAKRSVREYSADVFGMLDALDVCETLRRQTQALEADNPEQARRNRQIWGKVCEVFDALVEILGDEQVSLHEFARIVEAGFGSADMGLIPTAQIQVLAGDIERTRLPRVKALFVIGVNDGILPSAGESGALLDDDERRLLDPEAEQISPGGRRRGYEQQFMIYHALSAPTHKLYLSYSTGMAGNGKAMRPSVLISRIKRMYPLLKEQPTDYDRRIVPARAMFSRMGALLREYARTGEAESVTRAVYDWFRQSAEYGERLGIMRDIVHERTGGEVLSRAEPYGAEFGLNVSKLERYVQCPFAYFLRYNLRALERRIYEARAVELGSLYHDALDMFTKRLAERGGSWRELDADGISRAVDECLAELAPKLGSEVLLSTARYQYVVRQAARVLKRSIWALAEHIKSGEFEIFATEVDFGTGPVKAVTLELANGKRLTLQGRIDRVDIVGFDGKQYVKIIDYKSGANKFDLDDIYFGTQLQLMLYMDAFIRSGAQMRTEPILPGGVFYFNLNDPVVDYDEKTLSQLDDEILKQFKMSGLVLADARVVKALDRGIGRASNIIPATLSAKGEVGGASVASAEQFNALRAQVTERIRELGAQMSSGSISILPYKKGSVTGCTYCPYGAVCRFQGGKYNTCQRV